MNTSAKAVSHQPISCVVVHTTGLFTCGAGGGACATARSSRVTSRGCSRPAGLLERLWQAANALNHLVLGRIIIRAAASTRVLVTFYFRLQFSCSHLMNCWNLWKLGALTFHLRIASLEISLNLYMIVQDSEPVTLRAKVR